MKIFYSFYELESQTLKKRKGALLKVEFASDCIGYADCHPWSSLGDLPLEEQIDLLAKEHTTSLTARSLYFARLDADARFRKINLFTGLDVPSSHFLLSSFDSNELSLAYEEGFRLFKVKATHQDVLSFKKILPLLERLNSQLRVDFNNSLSYAHYTEWLKCVEGKEHVIDFFEDPCFFDSNEQVKKIVPLAADFNPCTPQTDIRIIKPAVECPRITDKKIVITSYLDHPFGQLTAAYTAAKTQKKHPDLLQTCGLLSHRIYEKNAFSEQLTQKGPHFTHPEGTGFGFDELLNLQDWKS